VYPYVGGNCWTVGQEIMDGQNKDDDRAHGWDTIDRALESIYGDQHPQHYAPKVYYALGGDQPLDGISIFLDKKSRSYHYVTYGFSELYSKETDDESVSGYGFEITFRLKYEKEAEVYPVWPVNLLQNIAKTVFSKGLVFDEYHTLSSGPIRMSTPTEITGIIFILDPTLGEAKGPNGALKFLQIF
jgi:suppressor of fused